MCLICSTDYENRKEFYQNLAFLLKRVVKCPIHKRISVMLNHVDSSSSFSMLYSCNKHIKLSPSNAALHVLFVQTQLGTDLTEKQSLVQVVKLSRTRDGNQYPSWRWQWWLGLWGNADASEVIAINKFTYSPNPSPHRVYALFKALAVRVCP